MRSILLSSFLIFAFSCLAFAAPKASDFSIDMLAEGLYNPMEMDIAPDGKVFIVELKGDVKVYNPEDGSVKKIAHFDVPFKDKYKKTWDKECGVMGLALAPDYAKSKWVYLTYSHVVDDEYVLTHRVSRFKFDGEKLDRSTEQIIMKIPARRDNNRLHEGGSLDFDKDGNLYISVGDNQLRDIYLYAARTASNSAVLNGKILRIHPEEDGSYTIPEGNLYPPGTPKAQPEIYVMGCRNPFRVHLDETTGFLYWGENGPPDHFSGKMLVDRDTLPEGYDEFNQAKQAGYFGWPLFVGKSAFPSYNYDTSKAGPVFDFQKPYNDVPMNHGLKALPPSQEPMVWYSHKPSPDFPSVGQGSASAIAGPVYHWNENMAEDALPKEFDNCWFIGDWARSWIKMVRLDENGNRVALESFLGDIVYSKPINMKFDSKGHLYVLQYGSKGWESINGSLIRIRYDKKGNNSLVSVVDDAIKGMDKNHPGTKLIIKNNCFACHKSKEKAIGPSYQAVADRYVCDETTIKALSKKITKGSQGTWGQTYAMPGHGYLKPKELEQILDSIFTLKTEVASGK